MKKKTVRRIAMRFPFLPKTKNTYAGSIRRRTVLRRAAMMGLCKIAPFAYVYDHDILDERGNVIDRHQVMYRIEAVVE